MRVSVAFAGLNDKKKKVVHQHFFLCRLLLGLRRISLKLYGGTRTNYRVLADVGASFCTEENFVCVFFYLGSGLYFIYCHFLF